MPTKYFRFSRLGREVVERERRVGGVLLGRGFTCAVDLYKIGFKRDNSAARVAIGCADILSTLPLRNAPYKQIDKQALVQPVPLFNHPPPPTHHSISPN